MRRHILTAFSLANKSQIENIQVSSSASKVVCILPIWITVSISHSRERKNTKCVPGTETRFLDKNTFVVE